MQKASFVCNGCKHRNRCGLTKYGYMPAVARKEYKALLSNARSGRSYSSEEIEHINKAVKADLKRCLSPYTIWANHKNELTCSHRTIHRLIEDRALGVTAFDLPCKIRLTGNGSEFSNPKAIKFDREDQRRARICYYGPSLAQPEARG